MSQNKIISGNDIYDNLRYATVKLSVDKNNGNGAIGTGFFFFVKLDDGHTCPLLVTNKHMVVDDNNVENWTSLSFKMNKADATGTPLLGDVVTVTIDNNNTQERLLHPEVDLCAFPVWDHVKPIIDGGTNLVFRDIPEAFIPNNASIQSISSIEEILMIGYPDGMADETHNLPIVRRGITATDYKIDYEGRKEFLIDASIFKGSSGSPILICNIGSFNNADGELCLGNRVIFLGVQYRGEFSKYQNNIFIQDNSGRFHNAPNVLSLSFNDLGFCVKSECLLYFKDEILRQGWK